MNDYGDWQAKIAAQTNTLARNLAAEMGEGWQVHEADPGRWNETSGDALLLKSGEPGMILRVSLGERGRVNIRADYGQEPSWKAAGFRPWMGAPYTSADASRPAAQIAKQVKRNLFDTMSTHLAELRRYAAAAVARHEARESKRAAWYEAAHAYGDGTRNDRRDDYPGQRDENKLTGRIGDRAQNYEGIQFRTKLNDDGINLALEGLTVAEYTAILAYLAESRA